MYLLGTSYRQTAFIDVSAVHLTDECEQNPNPKLPFRVVEVIGYCSRTLETLIVTGRESSVLSVKKLVTNMHFSPDALQPSPPVER